MKHSIPFLLLLVMVCLGGCQKMQQDRLSRQMKKVAKTYLKEEQITDYQNLTIVSVDTLTEYGYAKLNSELLGDMENYYTELYYDASDDTNRRNVISLYLNETRHIREDMEELIDNGDLLTEGVLLFMVTGVYMESGENQEFMFLVNPDKKTLHLLDPFGDNLLYKDME